MREDKDLWSRVARLERSSNRWRLATVGLLCVAVAAAITPRTEPPGPHVLELVSSDGSRRITLSAGNDIAGIWFTGPDGEAKPAIWAGDTQGAAIGIYGPQVGEESAFLTADNRGGSLQLLTNGKSERFGSPRLSE